MSQQQHLNQTIDQLGQQKRLQYERIHANQTASAQLHQINSAGGPHPLDSQSLLPRPHHMTGFKYNQSEFKTISGYQTDFNGHHTKGNRNTIGLPNANYTNYNNKSRSTIQHESTGKKSY